VLLSLTASSWAYRQTQIHAQFHNDVTTGAIIVSAAAAVSLLATWLLGTRSAVAPAAFSFLAGAAGTVGYFWVYVMHWSAFKNTTWPVKMNSVALSAVPVILGAFAIGLRRIEKRRRGSPA
jgi:hypothetical protein